jgi:DNA-binding winged helix-turn-helix (wHTH) protein/TolB-like protein
MNDVDGPIAPEWHAAPFRVGDNHVDPKRNRISGPAGETALQPKVIDVLCALVERQGEVLSRTELIDRVWGKEFGADESLTRAISQLRRAFGDPREEPRVIETISKRGYRLMVAPVAAEDGASRPRGSSRRLMLAGIFVVALIVGGGLLALKLWPAQPPSVRSERTGIVVTVEPFVSDDRNLPVSGLDNELSTELARSPLIRARAGTAPEQSGADTLQYRLRGEIHRLGDRLRINAHLDDAASGEALWGETFDRPYDPRFSARASVIAEVARESFLPLLSAAKRQLSRKPAPSLQPWEATLVVTWVMGSEGRIVGAPVEDSYWLQRHALEIDPDFAPAHALFAELAAYHALFHPPFDTPARAERARRHAERALDIAPYDAEVLYQLALYYRFSGDRERAESMLKRVLELQPNHPTAAIDLDFVRGECAANSAAEVASLSRRISTLAPTSAERWVALSHIAAVELGRGDFEQAREAALESRRIVPMTWTAYTLAAADTALGRNAEAAQVLGEHRREWPNMDLHDFADHVVQRWCLNGPRTGEVRRIFRHLADVVQPAHK